MSIAFDALSTVNSGGTSVSSPQTGTHTITGTNTVLLFGFNLGNVAGFSPTAVTYNSVTMTQLVTVADVFGGGYYIYGLTNPSTGSNTLSIAWSGGSTFFSGYGASYTGVKQSGLPDAFVTNTNSGATSIAATITTIADNAWAAVYGRIATGVTSLTNATSRSVIDIGGQAVWGDTNGNITPPGNYTITINGNVGSNNDVILLVSMAPVPVPPANGAFLMNFL